MSPKLIAARQTTDQPGPVSSHQEKILAHAERELSGIQETDPARLLPVYQRFLKIENHRLRLRHHSGGGGREICAARAQLIDVLLGHVFGTAAASVQKARGAKAIPLGLIALGGYGRSELNPGSDIDVMFLYHSRAAAVPAAVAEVVERVLYVLWDAGLKVGHSTRTTTEAIAQANQEMLTKTAMLEARHVVGDPRLYRRFRAQFRAHCVEKHEKDYIAGRMADQARRHQRFGNNVYLQEPNVKRGCGGMRDYQNLLWITFFKDGALTTTHLVGKDWLSEPDRRRIDFAYDFLLRVRTQLHYMNRRATDVLHLNVQAEAARQLGYQQATPIARSEAFMKDYYHHTRNIFRITERLTERFASGAATTTRRLFLPLLSRRKGPEEDFDGFFSRNGYLFVRDQQLLTRQPEQLMKAFEHAQERKLRLSPELSELLSRRLHVVTGEFRHAEAPRQIFLRLLSRKGSVARVLRSMHEVDLLGRYIPEFGQLTCLVQHEYFHRYTADEHTLVCIEKLDALLETENPKLSAYRRLFESLGEPFVLYLALLLHDTGRAVGARPHSEGSALFAQAVAGRLELTPEQRRSLVLLVDQHVTLSNFAQQRNLDDPATVIEFAGLVLTQPNLDALMLLTLADGQGTTDSWSDWKELLVWQLYNATSRYLSDQESFIAQNKIERQLLRDAVAAKLEPDFAEEIDAHFEQMPDNYFRAFGVDEIVQHLELFRSLWRKIYLQDHPAFAPVVSWKAQPERGHTVVSICTWDRRLLLSNIAGAFAVAAINILSADIMSRGDSLVLGILRVSNPGRKAVTNSSDMAAFESALRVAFENEHFDFAPQFANLRGKAAPVPDVEFPTEITVENKTHPMTTMIQLETPDRLGLLYDVVSCFDRAGIYVTLSRVSTEKGAAIDTFYVTDATTRTKITDPKRIDELQAALRRAIGPRI